jgi:thiol-disulfide isomerase/thioredoxin
MDQIERPGFDRASYLIGFVIICVALMLGAVAYSNMGGFRQTKNSIGGVIGETGRMAGEDLAANAISAPKGAGQAANNSTLPLNATPQQPAKEVTLDFMYADWCGHCQKMKPIVSELEAQLPKDRFEVKYWSEADSKAGKEASAVFAKYGLRGYPTFVINGVDRRDGEMPQASFKAWICSKFSSPLPEGC